MKRKFEFGCLLILTVLAFLILGALMRAQGFLPIRNQSYSVEYRPDLGIPTRVDWVVSDSLLGNTKRTPAYRFKADARTPRPRITSALYTRSGYQRGHMCPAADRSVRPRSMRETFLMTNVCPMASAVNTGVWKSTEEYARRIARQGRAVNVTAGALFFPAETLWIGKGRVAVPHAFIKFVWASDSPSFCKYWIIDNK